MMTQKGPLYIKVFSTLSGVRLVYLILSELNILCTSPVKWYYTKIMSHRSCVSCSPPNRTEMETFSTLSNWCFEFHRS